MNQETLSKVLFEGLLEVTPKGIKSFPEGPDISSIEAKHIIMPGGLRFPSNRLIPTPHLSKLKFSRTISNLKLTVKGAIEVWIE